MAIVKRICCPDCSGVGFTVSFAAANHISFENCEHCGGTGLIETPATDVDMMQFFCSIRTDREYLCAGCVAERACQALRSTENENHPQ